MCAGQPNRRALLDDPSFSTMVQGQDFAKPSGYHVGRFAELDTGVTNLGPHDLTWECAKSTDTENGWLVQGNELRDP
jgi:hypothetical protein